MITYGIAGIAAIFFEGLKTFWIMVDTIETDDAVVGTNMAGFFLDSAMAFTTYIYINIHKN